MDTPLAVSLLAYFTLMLAIGAWAKRRFTDNLSGYLLGGRQLHPAVTALSAGASDMSGWIIMGLPGALYLSGLSSAWIAIGLVIGAYLNYLIVAPRLRVYTELAQDAITLPDFFEHRFDDQSHILRIAAALVIILFFTLYTSSGLVAGGKLFESAFGQSYSLGLWVTAGVVVLYTLMGGFMAVSLTDFVQGCIMLIALVLVPFITLQQLNGFAASTAVLAQLEPDRLSLLSGVSGLAIASALAWGLGYFGQPHIIVRFMAIRSVKELPSARRIGMSWMILSLLGALGTGLLGSAYVAQQQLELADAETIFILLAQILFHPLIAGFLMAAILAAIMSTLSSQLLVTSSSLTEDLYRLIAKKEVSERHLVAIGRLSVMLVALVALLLAQTRDSSILQLVGIAWAGFGAAFGPLVIFSLFWRAMNKKAALAGMLMGAATVLFWVYAPLQIDGQPLTYYLYEMVPGFLVSALSIYCVGKLTGVPNTAVTALFDSMRQRMRD